MNDSTGPLRIDVRQPEDAAADPWAGALNLPVYKMDFVDKVAEAASADTPILLRGYREDLSASFAHGKLVKHGFAQVAVEEEGGSSAPEAAAIEDGVYPADPKKSRVGWTGRNIASSHWGSIPLIEGALTVEGGRLAGLSLSVDMARITCEDLDDRSMAAVLEAHLKNEDFFEADRFPVARFTSTRISPVGAGGSPRIAVVGDLEIRGTVREVSVEGVFGTTFEGAPAASASFEIDRTEWGALYGSPRFFRRLLGHFVREEISLDVKLVGAIVVLRRRR